MSDDYFEQIILELNHLEKTVEAIKGLIEKTELRTADIYDKAAASSFLSQFYNGIENILKRVVKDSNIELPKGDDSHLVLFEMFCPDVQNAQPEFILFTEDIKEGFVILRRFRHFARHGYAFQLDWERLQMGLKTVDRLFSIFRKNLLRNFKIKL